jgi:hypothetical protein
MVDRLVQLRALLSDLEWEFASIITAGVTRQGTRMKTGWDRGAQVPANT